MMCGMYFALKERELEKNTKYTFKQSFSIYFLNLILSPHHKKERLKEKNRKLWVSIKNIESGITLQLFDFGRISKQLHTSVTRRKTLQGNFSSVLKLSKWLIRLEFMKLFSFKWYNRFLNQIFLVKNFASARV